MKTTQMTLGAALVTVSFFGGLDYGFCVDPVNDCRIAIVGVTGTNTVEKIAAFDMGTKGVFTAREIVRMLNTDQVSETNLLPTIKRVRADLCA